MVFVAEEIVVEWNLLDRYLGHSRFARGRGHNAKQRRPTVNRLNLTHRCASTIL